MSTNDNSKHSADGNHSAAVASASSKAGDSKQSATAAAKGEGKIAVTLCFLFPADGQVAAVDGKCAVCTLTKPANGLKVILKGPREPSAEETVAAWNHFNAKRTVGGDQPTAVEICYLSASITDDDKKSLPAGKMNESGCQTCALTSNREVTAHANGYTTTIYFCWEHEKQMAKREDGTFHPINGLAR